jgi:uroporphyrinogen-III synthase
MQFIVTRPDRDAIDLGHAIEALDHHAILAPLLAMQATGAKLSFDGVQGVIATSRNALRALADGPYLSQAIRHPVFVVGAASAAMARRLGFSDVRAGETGARDLTALISANCAAAAGSLLYLSGDVVAFDLEPPLRAAGYDVRRQVVYHAVAATALPDAAVAALRGGADTGVLLMSRRSALVFVRLMEDLAMGAAARELCYICMSAAVADALTEGLGVPPSGRLLVADRPTSEEMLALVKELSSNRP